MQRSLDQIRAEGAFNGLRDAAAATLDLSEKLPAMLQTNGLLATWAHCLAKSKPAHPEFQNLLRLMLFDFQGTGALPPTADLQPADVFRAWVGPGQPLSGSKLRQLTAEALAFSAWLKRAAQAHAAGK